MSLLLSGRLLTEVRAAPWPMIYTYPGRDHGLSGHGSRIWVPHCKQSEGRVPTRSTQLPGGASTLPTRRRTAVGQQISTAPGILTADHMSVRKLSQIQACLLSLLKERWPVPNGHRSASLQSTSLRVPTRASFRGLRVSTRDTPIRVQCYKQSDYLWKSQWRASACYRAQSSVF